MPVTGTSEIQKAKDAHSCLQAGPAIPHPKLFPMEIQHCLSGICSDAAQKECPEHGLCCPHRCSKVELERAQRAAQRCRALQEQEQHPLEPSVNQPLSNDLALLVTGNYRSADTGELPAIHQPLDLGAGGLEAALHTKGKGLC